jgi:hypothetical protein
MYPKIFRKSFVIAVAIMATLASSSLRVDAGQDGSGIWVFNGAFSSDNMSISLINLTNYPLTYSPDTPCPSENGMYKGQPMLECGSTWSVDPFRTKVWTAWAGAPASPTHYDGRMTLYSTGFPDWSFDLVFAQQYAKGQAIRGMWVGLSPHGAGQGWSTAANDENWAYGRWITPVNDNKMHNIMTLIGPKCMVALYSSDNKNLVVVVQQLHEVDTNGATLWDDAAGDVYRGYGLDFVDNSGETVPGQ